MPILVLAIVPIAGHRPQFNKACRPTYNMGGAGYFYGWDLACWNASVPALEWEARMLIEQLCHEDSCALNRVRIRKPSFDLQPWLWCTYRPRPSLQHRTCATDVRNLGTALGRSNFPYLGTRRRCVLTIPASMETAHQPLLSEIPNPNRLSFWVPSLITLLPLPAGVVFVLHPLPTLRKWPQRPPTPRHASALDAYGAAASASTLKRGQHL